MKKKITLVATSVLLVAAMVIGGTLAYFTDITKSQTNTFTVGNVDVKLDETDITTNPVEPTENEDERIETSQEYTDKMVPGHKFVKDPRVSLVAGSEDAYVFLKMEMNKYVSLINLMGVDAYKAGIGGLKGDYPGFGAFVEMLANDTDLRAKVVGRWFTGIEHDKWQVMNMDEIKAAVTGAANKENPATLSIVLAYIGSEDDTMKAGDKVTFMTYFGMPDTVTGSMFDGEDAYKIEGVSKSNFNTTNVPFKMTFTAYAIQADTLTLNDAYAQLFPTTTP